MEGAACSCEVSRLKRRDENKIKEQRKRKSISHSAL